MEADPEEFIRKLQKAKEEGVNFVLVHTTNTRAISSSYFEIKELKEIDMREPTIQESGAVWFSDTEANRLHEFFPQEITEIRPLGEKII